MFRLNNIKQNLLIVTIAALLTGCGGGGSSDSTTIDSTTQDPKVAQDVQINTIITENSAIIEWIPFADTTILVEYGTKRNQYDSEVLVQEEGTVILYNLKAGTEYHYNIVAEDQNGKKVVSNDNTFTTLEVSTQPSGTEPTPTEPIVTEPAPTEPIVTEPAPTEPIVTEPAPTESISESTPVPLTIISIESIDITEQSIVISWELSNYATGQIEYGFDTSYGDVSIKEESFDYSKHLQRLSNLESDTIYHYRIISEDADGNRVVSEDRTFKTNSDGTVSTTPLFDNEVTITTPDGATVITGLQSGATVSAAINNSNVLNTALADGNKNLIIPSGEWYTGATVNVYINTTLTFEGILHQLKDATDSADYAAVKVLQGNVTLNNPHISQQGIVGGHGTHTCLAIYGSYNTGDITINGGILEWGGSNNFQGGRNNTIFNGTIFRDSVEHLVYANGISGAGDGDNLSVADGITFNDCIFERPGNGLYPELEANHVQIRNYKNVEFNNCTASGSPKTNLGQYGLLLTSVENCTVNGGSFSGYKSGLLFTSPDESKGIDLPMANVVFNNVNAYTSGNKRVRTSRGDAGTATFNNCTLNRPYKTEGINIFNSCVVEGSEGGYMVAPSGSNLTFDDCTWDYSDSTSGQALDVQSGASVAFTGTQTKINPTGGQSFSWDPLPK